MEPFFRKSLSGTAAMRNEVCCALGIKINNEHYFCLSHDGDQDDGRRDHPINLMPRFNQANPRAHHPPARQRLSRDPGHAGDTVDHRHPLLLALPGMYRTDDPLPADDPTPVQPQRQRHPAMRWRV